MRRQRVDTATGAVNAFEDAKEMPVPEHITLDATARIQWGIIMRTRAKGLWTENDLELAAELAVTRSQKSKIRREMDALDVDVDENPYYRLKGLTDGERQIENLVRRDERLTKLLQLHPEATIGKSKESVKQNTASREAREVTGGMDEYLASPVH